MRWVLTLVVVAGALFACSAVSSKWSFTETQTVTRGYPDAGTNNGVDLERASGYRVEMCPIGSDQITGGSVASYAYVDARSQWGRNKRQDMTVRGADWGHCEVFDDVAITYRGAGRYLPAADGVTVADGGTSVVMRVEAWSE